MPAVIPPYDPSSQPLYDINSDDPLGAAGKQVFQSFMKLTDFLETVGGTNANLRAQLNLDRQGDLAAQAKATQTFVGRAAIIQQAYETILAQAQLALDIYNIELAHVAAKSAYDGTVYGITTTLINAIGDYNLAVTNYQAGETAYQFALNDYNNAVFIYEGQQSIFADAKLTHDLIQPPTAAGDKVFAEAQQLLTMQTSIYSGALADYNVSKAVHNQSVNAYNTAAAAFQNSINTYNTAMVSARDGFIPVVNTFNATLSSYSRGSINVIRAGVGMPPLTAFPVSVQPSPTVGTALTNLGVKVNVPPATISNLLFISLRISSEVPQIVPMTVPPSTSNALKTYFTPILNLVIETTSSGQEKLALLNAYQDYATALNPQDPTLPNAYIRRIPSVFFSGPAESSPGSSGAMSSVLSVGLSNAVLSGIIDRAAYSAFLQQAGKELPEGTRANVNAIFQYIIADVANETGLSLPEQSDGTPKTNSIDSALAFAANVRSLVASGDIEGLLTRLILTDPNLSSLSLIQKQELIEPLANLIKLGLLQVALSQVGLSAGAPGLAGQVIGNLAGAPAVVAPSPQEKLRAAITDPFRQIVFKNDISLALGGGDQINAIINRALSRVFTQGNFATEEDFTNAVKQALLDEGLTQAQADKAARVVQDALDNQELMTTLDKAFSAGVLLGAVTSASNGTTPADVSVQFPAGSPNRLALDKVLREDINQPTYAAAAIAALSANNETVRDFRDRYISELTSRGVSISEAQAAANRFVALFKTPASTDPLIATGYQRILPVPQLVDTLTAHVVARVSPEVGPTVAVKKAQQTSRVTVGLLQDLNTQTHIANDNDKTFNKAAAAITVPQVALFALRNEIAARITNPVPFNADPLKQGNLDAGISQPTNFKRNTDINVA